MKIYHFDVLYSLAYVSFPFKVICKKSLLALTILRNYVALTSS